ncbi:hypothetical protein A3K34_02165 [candidate division WWE3 bacterium RIFOXYC1_FULL_40_10]|uniref:Glycosyltransferase RgtA/B/C/D-like domain-containing protein n=1 Tax=candidate division WWE3 bacterium RIFOXYA2_FULL_46_9 TaxID=1802636 RepID=A0A1F4W1J6_UNCKA|nr:MAG: hypothetical protein A3K58_02165 [candidate division WWE3 bacterium RIFOXYB1_FULL_40_22]OGC61658.1 MAG: hypothetical protein A3K37_02165 [candidate division WWE3 bacterium RIFOXYA1_FULL_40_11]OGC63284.1 MAG: hypothetical protein A2264_02785 [candidate division WWE3 bacterium RIFOXYA2_FULL_46_9]OGC64415.1 MAG: hypothetical protein A2326_02620 [candidate division WWE3 bacterium RIFOXYB2_FULL_41_6]OGC66041.1 MAG: hypothetical protein A3K34_02165 [candidate division WWE3 bacterium RIFOXYC1_
MKISITKQINRFFNKPGFDIYLTCILLLSAILRFTYLGYSDYQGDEIKALYIPSEGQQFTDFLFAQRKGPVQFIITYLLHFVDADYSNRFLIRLPFALAGFFSVYIFYKLIKSRFGQKVAFYSSFFFSTLGFLIAFSRIVQYQSFTILFMLLTLYFFSLAGQNSKFKAKGIFLGGLAWALGLLSHYDAIFVLPFAVYLLVDWFKSYGEDSTKKKLLLLTVAGLVSVSLVAVFYIPFFIAITDATKGYWLGRISGNVSAKLSSSRYLFVVYQPIYTLHIYTLLGILGGVFMLYRAILNKKNVWIYLALLLWILLPLAFMEKLVYVPGTHIYVYLIPLLVVISYGILAFEEIIDFTFARLGKVIILFRRIPRLLVELSISFVFLFVFAQAYAIYVDHYVEYPWTDEKFLLWIFPRPTPSYHLSMFGFPYNRNWDGIKAFVESFPQITAYSTNERSSITRYHIKLIKDANLAGFYIYIREPQTFTNTITSEKANWWIQRHDPEYVFSRNGVDLANIYMMAPGGLETQFEPEIPEVNED